MDFIIGGKYQGKKEYIEEHYTYTTVFEGAVSSLEELEQAEVILHVHLLIRRLLKEGMSMEDISEKLGAVNAKVISGDEIGYGLVPIDKFERMYREVVGRVCCQIAQRADNVIRMVCAVPTIIKTAGIQITFIRHGLTKGNEEKRYVGTTDESLSLRGKDELKMLSDTYRTWNPDCVLVSPMKRCMETARILFPQCDYQVVEEFRECDFGQFEYKNYKELDGNEVYQRFIDSGGMIGFPDGELPEMFRARCQEAFWREMQKIEKKTEVKQVVLVVHGGTIMSILDEYSDPHREYFSWQAVNGKGFTGQLFLREKKIKQLQRIK